MNIVSINTFIIVLDEFFCKYYPFYDHDINLPDVEVCKVLCRFALDFKNRVCASYFSLSRHIALKARILGGWACITIDKPFGQRLIKCHAFPKMARSSPECIEWLRGMEKLKVWRN